MPEFIEANKRDFTALITDTRITIETPEGAELPLSPAGFAVRTSAFLIDGLIKLGISIAVSIALSFLGQAGSGLFLIFYFFLEWFYSVFFEVWWHGQTPGKKRFKLTVVNDDGTPVTFAASVIRNLLRVVDFLPFAYITALVVCVMNQQFKRIGDLAAGTMVVYAYEKRSFPSFEEDLQRPVPSDFTTEEQRALLDFAERSAQLSPQRQAELAAVLAPVVGEQDTLRTIKQMAKSLLGDR